MTRNPNHYSIYNTGLNYYNFKAQIILLKYQDSIVESMICLLTNELRLTFCPTCSTISHRATRRILQLVHVKSTTIANSDAVFPLTATAGPVITNVPSDDSLRNCGMFSVQPTRSVSSTSPCRSTWLRDLGSSSTGKSVPFFGQTVVAFYHVFIVMWYSTICIGQRCVRAAFWEFKQFRSVCNRSKPCLNFWILRQSSSSISSQKTRSNAPLQPWIQNVTKKTVKPLENDLFYVQVKRAYEITR